MNLLRFVPIKLTLLLVLGILLGRHLQPDIILPVTFTGLFLMLLGFLFYRDKRVTSFNTHGKTSVVFGILVVLSTISIGILTVSSTYPKNQPGHYAHKEVTGSHLWKIKIHEVLKTTTFSDRYVGKVLALENEKVLGRLLLSFPSEVSIEKLTVDDELIIYAKLSEINAPLNPHQFDYQNYLEGLGITNQLRLRGNDFFTVKNPDVTLYGTAARFRNQIIANLKKTDFGKEELGIIQALLLGQRNDISAETYENYKNAGAVHILAVSGLHIGIILLLLQFLLRPLERLPKGKTLKLILIVVMLWGFAVLAGLSASVVRAVTMFSFVAYALYLNRPSSTFNILALSMFFILLIINPMLIFQVGFQMSYAAVFAIVWMYPLLQRLWNPKNKIVRYFWQLLSVSIAAQLGVLPVSLFYFHQFPGLFFISNLLIVPALGLILGTGILVIFLALFNGLPDILVTAYDHLIRWMNNIIGWVAQQEAFVFRNISFDAVQLVLAYTILISAVLFFSKISIKKVIALSMAVIGFQLWLFNTSYQTRQKETLFLAHQTRNSVLMHRTGSLLSIAGTDTTRLERLTADYQIAERIASLKHASLNNAYQWRDKNLLIIDSLSVYPTKNTHLDYVLLTGSPKLNLERFIDSIRPKTIVADGSNYRSYVERWRKTCNERKLPFHFTGEEGAFYFD